MTCREAATLMATGQLDESPLATRVRVRLHAAMCRHCRRFRRQLRDLQHGARTAFEAFDAEIPADLERRITSRLVDKR